MSRERTLLVPTLSLVYERYPRITGHVIKARAGAVPLAARLRHLDDAIADARAVVDELVTKRSAIAHGEKGRTR